MTQLLVTPPRAAETNEPVSLVGRVVSAAGGSNGAGVCGCDTAFGSNGSSSALSAHTPAVAAPAPAPMRSIARRFTSAARVMMPPADLRLTRHAGWPVS